MGDSKDLKPPSLKLPLITKLKVFLYDKIRNACTRSDGTVNRRVLSLLTDLRAAAPATKRLNASTVVSTSDVAVDPTRNLWFRLFIPSGHTHTPPLPLPLLVYFHGGGFCSYGADSKIYDQLCTHLAARLPAVVVSVNYRLAPEYKYPSQYEDGFDVLKFIDSEWKMLPAIGKCFIGGDSAGGNIAHHVTVAYLQKTHEFSNISIAGVIGVQPFFGGEERLESELRLRDAPVLTVKQTDVFWREFLPEDADRNHPAAHVYVESEILRNLDFPATLVVVGGVDPLQDWDIRYAEWLRECGEKVEVIEYPNAFHAFYLCTELPEFALLMDDVAKFVQTATPVNH